MTSLVRTVGYLPEHVISNDELARIKHLGDGMALERMGGVEQRRVWGFGIDRPLHELARCAVMLDQNMACGLLIHASTTPDCTSPAGAHRLHQALGFPKSTAACDVLSSCTSVLSALAMAPPHTLIVAAEAKSRHIAEGDTRTGSLFGDAAVSMLLGANNGLGERIWLEPFVDSQLVHNIRVENAPGPFGRLVIDNGKVMFRRTVSAFVLMIERAMEAAAQRGWILSTVYLHQANAHLLADVKKTFPQLFVPVLISDIGNTVSVSLPLHRLRVLTLLALRQACVRSGRFFDGPGLANAALRRRRLAETPKSWILSVDPSSDGTTKAAGLVGTYGEESFVLLDGACQDGQLPESWLGRVSEQEWAAFFAELEEHERQAEFKQKLAPVAEAWIGAGGGFQALGFIQKMTTAPDLIAAEKWRVG